MEYEEIICENLSAINEDFDMLKPKTKKYITEIETLIQNRYATQENAIQTLKSIDFSLKSIATELGISRTTLYNNEHLLKRYIEQSTTIALKSNPFAQINKVQEEKSLLQDQINKLIYRDLDMELLKVENKELAASLKGKNDEILRLQNRISELGQEIQRLKTESPSVNKTRRVFPKK